MAINSGRIEWSAIRAEFQINFFFGFLESREKIKIKMAKKKAAKKTAKKKTAKKKKR